MIVEPQQTDMSDLTQTLIGTLLAALCGAKRNSGFSGIKSSLGS
jgi:hypothetical protein